jgi:hypothetical protein
MLKTFCIRIDLAVSALEMIRTPTDSLFSQSAEIYHLLQCKTLSLETLCEGNRQVPVDTRRNAPGCALRNDQFHDIRKELNFYAPLASED